MELNQTQKLVLDELAKYQVSIIKEQDENLNLGIQLSRNELLKEQRTKDIKSMFEWLTFAFEAKEQDYSLVLVERLLKTFLIETLGEEEFKTWTSTLSKATSLEKYFEHLSQAN